MGFDEALETKDVKFVKQNISGNLTNQATMMSKIKAVQSERERLSMLFAEYIDDNVVKQDTSAINSRKDSLWSLVEKLSSAFNHPDPLFHDLFKDVPEINEKGISQEKHNFKKYLDKMYIKLNLK